MNDAQIKHMVNRFLGWKLPATFSPDNGISFDRFVPHQGFPPVGTNVFNADEAEAMVRHMIEGLPGEGASEHPIVVAARAEADKFYSKDAVFDKAAFVDGARFALNHSSN